MVESFHFSIRKTGWIDYYIKMHIRKYITHVFLPVFLGGVIYSLFRDTNLVIFRLIDNNLLNNLTLSLQQIFMPIAGIRLQWLWYSLPDALWCYAGISFVLICWKEGPLFFKVFWLFVATVLSLGFEVGQFLNMVPGTFCVYDLIFSISAIALALSNWEGQL